MEFIAIVDAKARAPTGCAAVGVYENGDLGASARHIDKQLEGLITRVQGSGDFAAKLGDALMLPQPSGATVSRLLLIGLGSRAAFGRKQYRKAMLSCAQALAKTGASDAAVYLAMEPVPELDIQYRARIVAEVFLSQSYKIPDLKTSPRPKARRLATVNVAVADARAETNQQQSRSSRPGRQGQHQRIAQLGGEITAAQQAADQALRLLVELAGSHA